MRVIFFYIAFRIDYTRNVILSSILYFFSAHSFYSLKQMSSVPFPSMLDTHCIFPEMFVFFQSSSTKIYTIVFLQKSNSQSHIHNNKPNDLLNFKIIRTNKVSTFEFHIIFKNKVMFFFFISPNSFEMRMIGKFPSLSSLI